jgi:hypothetical protein
MYEIDEDIIEMAQNLSKVLVMVTNYLISVWLAVNCIGAQLGTVVVPHDQCVEPKFGLAFKTNGTQLTVSSSCPQTKMVNNIQCASDGECCYVPQGLSVNITETSLTTDSSNTRLHGLPQATTGRTFVCVEQLVP